MLLFGPAPDDHERAAQAAASQFERVHVQREAPEEIEELAVAAANGTAPAAPAFTLDESTLEIVAATLESLAQGDRMVEIGCVELVNRRLTTAVAAGIAQATLTVYGAKTGLHSGHYGNWAPNPAMALARLLASSRYVADLLAERAGGHRIGGPADDAHVFGGEQGAERQVLVAEIGLQRCG